MRVPVSVSAIQASSPPKKMLSACRIASGVSEKLRLGNIEVIRDWGWAPEYVDAMWRMLQQESPEDFVIATGESHSLREFMTAVFSTLNLNWQDHVVIDPKLFRPSDLAEGRVNPRRAEEILGWRTPKCLGDVVGLLVKHQLIIG